ncbi:hypothetical protein D3C80_752190 [compost metagenome]
MTIDCASSSIRSMIGSSIALGRSPLILVTASRTSFIARSGETRPSSNSTVVTERPSPIVDDNSLIAGSEAIAFSTSRVTSVSSSTGVAPDCSTVTFTAGVMIVGK